MGYLPRKVSVTSGTVRYTCGSASGGEMEGCDSVSRWRQGIRPVVQHFWGGARFLRTQVK